MPESRESLADAMQEKRVALLPAKHRNDSPLNFLGWTYLLRVVVLCVLSAIAHFFLRDEKLLSAGAQMLLGGAACFFAFRFICLDCFARRFWRFWVLASLLGALCAPWLGGIADWLSATVFGGALAMLAVFFVFRRYRSYRHLSSRRRAGIFFLGLLSLIVCSIGWDLHSEDASLLLGLVENLARFSMSFLRLFWLFSLIHLFLHMRLHFMRIHAKLAASGLFLTLLPVLLLIGIGLLATWTFLGESRAARGKAILNEWISTTDAGLPLRHIPWAATFEYPGASGDARPAWLPDFLATLEREPGISTSGDEGARQINISSNDDDDSGPFLVVTTDKLTSGSAYWLPADTTAIFNIGNELWLLRLHGTGVGRPSLSAYRFGDETMARLARLLASDTNFRMETTLSTEETHIATNGDENCEPDSLQRKMRLRGVVERPAAADSTSGWTEKSLGFGLASMGVLRLGEDSFLHDTLVMMLQVRPADLARDLFGPDNPLSNAIFISFLIIAGLMLLVLMAGLYFGFRITGGITSAVIVLHKRTKQLAKGDLDTIVELPNEDEFGDLAHSFNEMTIAIRKGRREAVLRERLERELIMAQDIQARLFPDADPALSDFEITGTSLPSRQVGGDYFDFLSLGQDRTGIAIGDVSGKGVPAALLMSNLQASLQGQVIHPSTVAEVVARVNDLLVRSTDDNMFATFVYCLLDEASANLTLTNAGHNPPILCKSNGSVVMLDTGGLILGMLPRQVYKQETIHLDPGDVLVMFTDGITEAEAPPAEGVESSEEGEMFGEERLIKLIRENVTQSAMGIRESILRAVKTFTRGQAQSDDITLVIVKRRVQTRTGS